MLGGFAQLHKPDILTSQAFIRKLQEKVCFVCYFDLFVFLEISNEYRLCNRLWSRYWTRDKASITSYFPKGLSLGGVFKFFFL